MLDHLPDPTTISSTLNTSFSNLKLDAAGVTKFGKDQLDAVFGRERDGNVLFWAHHEKLCLIDRKIAFMGGLDLCFGRWDTNNHPLSDVHSNIATTVFPGQDYNNARILDFNDVSKPFENKLDRTQSSRMGWSDISCSVEGVVVQDLMKHFTDRWNFIFDEKYNVRKDVRYSRLSMVSPQSRHSGAYGQGEQGFHQQGAAYNQSGPQINFEETYQPGDQSGQFAPPPGSQPYAPPAWQSTSRPHTPSYDTQHTTHGISPSPQLANYQQPPASHTDQHFYPPPPPGGPPNLSPQPPYAQQHSQPTQEYAGNQYVSPPSNTAELGPVNYRATEPQTDRSFDEDLNPAYYDQQYQSERGLHGKLDQYRSEGQRFSSELRNIGNQLGGQLQNRVQNVQGTFLGGTDRYGRPLSQLRGGNMTCQIVRSCTLWSNGTQTEHSVQDAYIDIIRKSQHFVYIENQFFITKSNDYTSYANPVKNQIGRAIVDRILQAARAGEQYKVIVLIPSVPGFAGDLRDESSLGTRAIMELQYDSICRGGNSIFDLIAKAGYNPQDYIRFYNLRNYDRINLSRAVQQVEQQSGVQYEDARRQHDDIVGAGFGGYGEGTRASSIVAGSQYQQYQQAAMKPGAAGSERWDSVSECYMLNGTDIRSVPWDGALEAEIDAFVSEELYIHSKVRRTHLP
jgi:phospholipase D1/2